MAIASKLEIGTRVTLKEKGKKIEMIVLETRLDKVKLQKPGEHKLLAKWFEDNDIEPFVKKSKIVK